MRIISRRVAGSIAISVTVLSLLAGPAGAFIDVEPPIYIPPHDPVLIAAAGERIEGWANAVLWVHTIAWNEEIARQEAEAEAARARARPATSAPAARQATTTGTGACGGDLPDCSIVQCESGFDITAENGRSSAAGKYQFIQSTANNLPRAMGRPDLVGVPASRWTEAEQDDAARILWRGGAGASNWEQCL